jgi:hypothetical protein
VKVRAEDIKAGDRLARGALVHKVEHFPEELWRSKGGVGRDAVFVTFGSTPVRIWLGEYETMVEIEGDPLDGIDSEP